MTDSNHLTPLYVDLDGTLIKSDVTFEALLLLLRQNVFYLVLIPFWFLKGLPYLKQQVADRVEVGADNIPFNEEFLRYLKAEKQKGRKLILISASWQQHVESIGRPLGLFDRIEGTGIKGTGDPVNLKSHNKLKRIRELTPEGEFAYAGNAHPDLAIWAEAAQPVLVNCPAAIAAQAAKTEQELLCFDRPDSFFKHLLRAMRPHQWLKNGLIFLPLFLSHQASNLSLLLSALIGFISFSLCASSVYLVNDMLDLDSDRRHPVKRQRPFAAGALPLSMGFAVAPVLLLAAFATALLLPNGFLLILFCYWLLTSLYSLILKQLFLVDVVVLALLYTLRIVAGSAAITVVTTRWLVAFSLSLFLGLALVKRVTELTRLGPGNGINFAGRAYHTDHRRLMLGLGIIASVLAVAVFALYINAPETTGLYESPQLLWLICPLLLFLLARIWRQAWAGTMAEDPMLFAVTDHISQAVMALCGVILWLAV